MPHLVAEGEEYLGVRFIAGPTGLVGRGGRYTLELLYYGEVDYSALRIGTRFTVREGAKVVGEGVVVRVPDETMRAGR